ncbi:hypothetical protein DEJ13_03545 [Curtobacterium sp. MCLR17_007]|uniref:hypothetical protein n=1 Tax=Curtobacterium sp. MCLR17_007 TaxID=2175648 RepID=UPI000DA71523|nr:hypothetical protein [Curtobacterium sp. MCLR17_007]WIB60920.1 hypothetical protein DEJ13_03545 [Curtobacterium sp. MCLR17_007]
MTAELPVPTWTWRASIRLELRALGWMLGVTLPTVTVLGFVVATAAPALGVGLVDGTWWSDALNAVVWAVYMAVISAIPTVVGAVVALPFTMVLGLLMRPVRHRAVHVVATSLLAGTLAAVPFLFVSDAWVLATPVVLAAGAAGALARHGVFRRADRAREARPTTIEPAAAVDLGA